ncbi:MAG: Lrp/AsnC family transcriptional regulator [Cellvibrionaceae bacterium]|nr:Lrp/AsnC family transcriptional regulator [Cellvibrionaceae bacterium]MCV6625724.1 Lrp/AsnC family transcriptional regulator [Cellvibrionaceae bacterium]
MPMSHKLDKTDRKILEILQRDGSLSNLELADKIALSPSPCSRRVRMLEDAGYFKGTVTLVNPEAIGVNVHVFIQVSLGHQVKSLMETFENTVASWPEVMECYLMAGDFDYLIRAALPDLAAYQQFLDEKLTQFEGIASIKSSFSLKQVQYKTEMPLEHL